MIAIAPINEWSPSKWPGMNVAFLTSFFASLILTFAVIPYGKRRPVGKPLSWGEAMLAAGYVFGVMFLCFGIVPHQWLTYVNSELLWTRDKIVLGPGGLLKPKALGGNFPFTLQYEAVRDIVVVLLHALYFGLIIYLWSWWQKRGQAKTTEIEVSSFGRPLVKKA